MDRRSFVKMLGALPLLTIFKSKPSFGLDTNNEARIGTGTNSILKIIEDLRPGQLMVLASRPCMGKSSVALNLLNELGADKDQACAYFSLEMSQEDLMVKRNSVASGIPFADIKKGTLSEAELVHLNQVRQTFIKENIFINDDSDISAKNIAEQVSDLKKSGRGIKYLFVDYLNLMRSEQISLSRCDQVAENLRLLKELALKENLVVISLAQLNRETKAGPERRPVAADFRETKDLSSIDKLILLYRADHGRGEPDRHFSELEFLTYHGAVKAGVGYRGMLNKLTLKIRDLVLVS